MNRPPFISFFSFQKQLLENVGTEASVLFVSFLCVWLGIPQSLSSPQLSLHTPPSLCPSWTSARFNTLEAGERMTWEPALWLISALAWSCLPCCPLWLRSHEGLYGFERILQPVNSALLPQG